MILLAQSHCHLLIFSKIIWNLRQYKKNISWNQISRQQFLNCLLILLFWLAVGCQSTMVAVSVSSMMKTFRFVTFDRIERGKGVGGGDMRMGGAGWRRTQLIPKMGAAQIENLLILETFNFSWNNHKEILPILSEQILWQCHQFCQNSDSLIKPFKFQVWPTLTINFGFLLYMLDIYVQVQKEIGKTNCPFEISAPEVVLYYLKPSCFMESLLFS